MCVRRRGPSPLRRFSYLISCIVLAAANSSVSFKAPLIVAKVCLPVM